MIKYHDNINGVQYGADHTLTNNWNPVSILGALIKRNKRKRNCLYKNLHL